MLVDTAYVTWFYEEMSWPGQYLRVFYSVVQAFFGSGIGPIGTSQLILSIIINLMGKAFLGLLFTEVYDVII